MKDKKKYNNLIEKNSGSTLLTVIVAISFVTILTLIILGSSMMNIRMKGIDRHVTDDFYYAEKALNDIYTGLGQEMTVVATESYDEAFSKLGDAHDSSAEAEEEFKKLFSDGANKKLFNTEGFTDSDRAKLINKLKGYVTISPESNARCEISGLEKIIVENKDGDDVSLETDEEKQKVYKIVLKDLKVSYIDKSDYQSTITTDIVIYVPTPAFLNASVDITDYAIIANKGLYVNGDSTIEGNVYAGIHNKDEYSSKDEALYENIDQYKDAGIYGGININGAKVEFKNGNYIVSKGNVNLTGNNPSLVIGEKSAADADGNSSFDSNLINVWFNSIKTLDKASITALKDTANPSEPEKSRTIDVNANMFALNDMVLNANNSNVAVKGNYYGYNDGTLGNANLDSEDTRENTESSAIIINGNGSTLDMSTINNFVLMGRAYIDYKASGVEGVSVDGGTDIVATAEGVALNTNQQLYLLPIEFISGSNPYVGTYTSDIFKLSYTEENLDELKNWFGFDYINPKEDKASFTVNDLDKIYDVYKITKGSETVYYAYLKFNDKAWEINEDGSYTYVRGADPGDGGTISSQAAFFRDIINEKEGDVQPTASKLKSRIEGSIMYENYFNLQDCIIGTADDTVVYAKNAVVNYDVDRLTSTVTSNLRENDAAMDRFSNYRQNLFRRYQLLCTELNAEEEKSLETTILESEVTDSWEIPSGNDATPMSHFVRINEIENGQETSNNEIDELKSSGKCIVKNGNLEINENFKGVAIVVGDITVNNSIVNGLLMATGTITLNGNSKVYYDKGLIQTRIEKEISLARKTGYSNDYLINYLSDESRQPGDVGAARLYNVGKDTDDGTKQYEADYNEFIQYENWKKGER